MIPDDAALLDALYDEDALYEQDPQLAGRELPPRPWRASQRAVDEVIAAARLQLDRAWKTMRDRSRHARTAEALCGHPIDDGGELGDANPTSEIDRTRPIR